MIAARTTAIVTDIEGTTSSLAFVHDVLFPYAREALPEFVRRNRNDPTIAAALQEVDGDTEVAIAMLIAWIDEDRKAAPLKLIQGRIWALGYADGTLKGHVYADAALALRSWHARGIALYVYSSGSIEAQKLIFAHSIAGDLTPCFRGYFDSTIGAKVEAASYARIGTEIGVAPAAILFLSDNPAELRAARAAGVAVIGVQRGGADAALNAFTVVRGFDELALAVPVQAPKG